MGKFHLPKKSCFYRVARSKGSEKFGFRKIWVLTHSLFMLFVCLCEKGFVFEGTPLQTHNKRVVKIISSQEDQGKIRKSFSQTMKKNIYFFHYIIKKTFFRMKMIFPFSSLFSNVNVFPIFVIWEHKGILNIHFLRDIFRVCKQASIYIYFREQFLIFFINFYIFYRKQHYFMAE